jgi:CheY-like chemotaxis protein
MAEKVILLVEDNPDDEALMLRAFQRSKLANRIEVARDGVEALEFLLGEDARPLPTLVILDLKLPRIDGLEVLRRVRSAERTRALPVVVLTSSREEQDLVESYRLGANSYVRKPVDFVQFAEATQTLGLYWLVVNEPPPTLGGT